jgi:5-methylcytosine-specific restriction endonuclease McrA
MPRLSSTLEILNSDTKNWLESERRAAFVRCRRLLCNHTDALTIEVPTIFCESCFAAKVDGFLVTYRMPDVLPESWEADLVDALDENSAQAIAQDSDSPRCQSCHRNLHGKTLYAEIATLAERLGISDETLVTEPSRKNPSRQLWSELLWLYGRRCFGCGSDEYRLEVDHIEPQSHEGKADFDNLQPLCRKCNNDKRDQLPRSVVIVRDPWSDQH